MGDGFTQSISTILIFAALAVIIAGVIVYLVRQKKKGQCSCGGDCSSCSACSDRSNDSKDN